VRPVAVVEAGLGPALIVADGEPPAAVQVDEFIMGVVEVVMGKERGRAGREHEAEGGELGEEWERFHRDGVLEDAAGDMLVRPCAAENTPERRKLQRRAEKILETESRRRDVHGF
jgi:hypothetical protein